ncbi:hypothetical protein T484DRAFT_1902531, partial [Baffinella frigidus]
MAEGQLRERAGLLVLLLGSEVRRMTVWHNPRKIMSDASLLERPLGADASHSWGTHVRTAWGAHPHLAVMLLLRFPVVEVRAAVRKCAAADPLRLVSLRGTAQALSLSLLANSDLRTQSAAFSLAPSLPLPLIIPLLALAFHSDRPGTSEAGAAGGGLSAAVSGFV